jgi:hypothetical protein
MFNKDDRFTDVLIMSNEDRFELMDYANKEKNISNSSANDLHTANMSQCAIVIIGLMSQGRKFSRCQ